MATAHVRLVNCTLEKQRIEATIDGSSQTSVGHGEQSEYVSVGPGSTDIVVTTDDGAEIRETLRLDGGDARTVVVIGGDDEPHGLVTMKDEKSSIASGRSHVRFFNGVPGSTRFELRFDDTIVDDDSAVLSENIGYGQNGTHRSIPAGSHRFGLYVDPSERGAEETRLHTEQSSFEGGRAYTIAALPARREDEYELLLLEDVPLAPPQA